MKRFAPHWPPRPRRRALSAFALIATTAVAIPALATRYWEAGPLLSSFFSASKRVAPLRVSLSEAEASEIARRIGTASVKRDWNVYFAETDGKRDGFAILDAQIGLHEPIDFGIRFTPAGAVDRVEILEFREPYGDGVRSERFRQQFVGKTAKDPIEAGRDIDIVSGATYSSKSVALGVKRATLLLDLARKKGAL